MDQGSHGRLHKSGGVVLGFGGAGSGEDSFLGVMPFCHLAWEFHFYLIIGNFIDNIPSLLHQHLLVTHDIFD